MLTKKGFISLNSIPGLPSFCPCGQMFSTVHALECKKGGFVDSQHDEIRNLEEVLLSKGCKDVMIEPSPKPLTGETFSLLSTITDDCARLDVKARDFYRPGQCAFFDIRVAQLNARSYGGLSTETILERAEKEKKWKYNTRVIEVEHGTFVPLVFGTEKWVKNDCAKSHKLLAAKLA